MNNENELVEQSKSLFLNLDFQVDPFGCQGWEFPCQEPLGFKGRLVVFQSQFGQNYKPDVFLTQEMNFLFSLNLGECYYGAGSFPIFPFLCESSVTHKPLRGIDILTALKPRNFRSEHIQNLEATAIPYPGYHPYTENDEIHDEFAGQHIFGMENAEDAFTGVHGVLKRFVSKEQLWYALFHTTPEQNAGFAYSRYVLLFAVGQSPYSDRLLGVVTHQVCHNLCD
jgi:hypothetical protein